MHWPAPVPRPDIAPWVRLTSTCSCCPASHSAMMVTVVTRPFDSNFTLGSIFSVNEGTTAGLRTGEVGESMPSWPNVLSPQQRTEPLAPIAHVWRLPAAIRTSSESAFGTNVVVLPPPRVATMLTTNMVGTLEVSRGEVLPSPICPALLSPQQAAVLPARRTHV